MKENYLADAIEAAYVAIRFIEDQTDELLVVLPEELAETGTPTEKCLNRIYSAIKDVQIMLRGAEHMADPEPPEEIEAAKEDVGRLRRETWN